MRRTNRAWLAGVHGYVAVAEPARPGRRLVVEQWERALVFRDGALARTLGPGAYRSWSRRERVRRVDVRPWVLQVPTQEVPTADGVTVKITAAGRVRVVDPEAWVTAAQDPSAVLYLAVQVALRELVTVTTVADLLASRPEVAATLAASVRGLDEVGVALDALELKDVVLPPDLKRAQSEVLIGRAEGQAALERARGETAALRSLANAARLCADNPALLQLRLVQQLAGGAAPTVVITTPPFGPGAPL
jgi:regulator of protease activity HflC (stomatin/prohibitin superfamily)